MSLLSAVWMTTDYWHLDDCDWAWSYSSGAQANYTVLLCQDDKLRSASLVVCEHTSSFFGGVQAHDCDGYRRHQQQQVPVCQGESSIGKSRGHIGPGPAAGKTRSHSTQDNMQLNVRAVLGEWQSCWSEEHHLAEIPGQNGHTHLGLRSTLNNKNYFPLN